MDEMTRKTANLTGVCWKGGGCYLRVWAWVSWVEVVNVGVGLGAPYSV